ncbi:MAG: RusA family crossover junction endodeoxyribonuclease [Alkaliphilus sp.]
MTKILIVIPEIHPSLNEWARKWHYKKIAKEKKRWNEMVRLVSLATRTKKPLTSVEIDITYFFKDKKRRDRDNYTPKFILDGIVHAGIIKDDDFETIKRQNIHSGFDSKNPRTEVTIREIK